MTDSGGALKIPNEEEERMRRAAEESQKRREAAKKEREMRGLMDKSGKDSQGRRKGGSSS